MAFRRRAEGALPFWEAIVLYLTKEVPMTAPVKPTWKSARDRTFWGVLYRISDADLEKLTKEEGGYHPVRLQVQVVQDTPSEMWIYLAKKPNTSLRLRPYTWYKRFLIEGAREHCLPAEYIAFLEGIEAIEDADRERDKRKRALACQA
jgi:gamma-glutamylcyclotransferase